MPTNLIRIQRCLLNSQIPIGTISNLENKKMIRYHLICYILLLMTLSACNDKVSLTEILKEKPTLFPDYVGVTIPATIAPLNFKVREDYTAIDAVIEGHNTEAIHIQDAKEICIPSDRWAKMLVCLLYTSDAADE